MRIGLLGGTLDPVHCGHLDAARAARDTLGLERVWFVPASVPPHRTAPFASAYHRFAMAAMAVDGERGFAVTDRELTRPGPSYSVDTLIAFQREGWQKTQLFFITGVDAFAEIETWRSYPGLLDESHFVVVTRPGHALAQVRARLPDLAWRFVEAADCERCDAALAGPRTAIVFLEARTANVSSTNIRSRLAAGEPLAGLVPVSVERHIRQHQLYAAAAAPQLHGQV
jgi:nicotinate-nucleotide adenylyltransferase